MEADEIGGCACACASGAFDRGRWDGEFNRGDLLRHLNRVANGPRLIDYGYM
jgi:hypothetical protein